MKRYNLAIVNVYWVNHQVNPVVVAYARTCLASELCLASEHLPRPHRSIFQTLFSHSRIHASLSSCLSSKSLLSSEFAVDHATSVTWCLCSFSVPSLVVFVMLRL